MAIFAELFMPTVAVVAHDRMVIRGVEFVGAAGLLQEWHIRPRECDPGLTVVYDYLVRPGPPGDASTEKVYPRDETTTVPLLRF